MHNLISKLFKQRGIKDATELQPEEQAVFEQWETVLNKDELTLDDLKRFCSQQIKIIEAKWADYNVGQDRKAELIPYHTVYSAILAAIDSPKQAREALEMQLTQMLK